MKRSGVCLPEVADFGNLSLAFHAAAKGKRARLEVKAFEANLNAELASLRADILGGTVELGKARRFQIRDPKPRLIHAPVFRERVLHHAVINHAGPVLDRALAFDVYACRAGKGTLAAVQRAAQQADRFPWFVQIDIRRYFASIDHAILLGLLARKFKDAGMLALLDRIVRSHGPAAGLGSPIGALTSQHFANFYLAGLDRLMVETCGARAYLRYMDDCVWWTDDRASARVTLTMARDYLSAKLRLEVKRQVRIGRSGHGLNFRGFRILPGRLLLSRRRCARYRYLRRSAERNFVRGAGDARQLQADYATALSLTVHADAVRWRREELVRRPLDPAVAEI